MRVITFQIPKLLSSMTRVCLKLLTTSNTEAKAPKRVKKSKSKA